MVKRKIYSHVKNISSNYIFSKSVDFTKFWQNIFHNSRKEQVDDFSKSVVKSQSKFTYKLISRNVSLQSKSEVGKEISSPKAEALTK